MWGVVKEGCGLVCWGVAQVVSLWAEFIAAGIMRVWTEDCWRTCCGCWWTCSSTRMSLRWSFSRKQRPCTTQNHSKCLGTLNSQYVCTLNCVGFQQIVNRLQWSCCCCCFAIVLLFGVVLLSSLLCLLLSSLCWSCCCCAVVIDNVGVAVVTQLPGSHWKETITGEWQSFPLSSQDDEVK